MYQPPFSSEPYKPSIELVYTEHIIFNSKKWILHIYNNSDVMLNCTTGTDSIKGYQIILEYLKIKIDEETYLNIERKIFENIC